MTEKLVLTDLNPPFVVQDGDSLPAATVIEMMAVLRGKDGADGRDGHDATTFPFPFPAAAMSWAITHGLNRYPSVTLVDLTGEVIGGAVDYPDSNTVHVSFAVPVAGTAYLN